MDRDVLRVASIFRARREARQRQERGREGVYAFTSAVLVFCVIAEEICVASVVRMIRENSLAARMRRISALLWLHFRLFVVQEGTWQLAVRIRGTIAMSRLFYSFFASTDSLGLGKSRLQLRFILWILDAVILFSGACNVLNVGQICTLSRSNRDIKIYRDYLSYLRAKFVTFGMCAKTVRLSYF